VIPPSRAAADEKKSKSKSKSISSSTRDDEDGRDAARSIAADRAASLAAAAVASASLAEARLDPNAAESNRLTRVAEALIAGGRPADALLVLHRALALTPRCLDAIAKKGMCHQALGSHQDAHDAYAAVLAVEPTHALALRAVGALYQAHGFLSEAAGAFKSALRSDPADRPTIERLAATLTDLGTRTKLLGSPNAAIEYYREASAVDGGYAPAFYNLGVVLSETNRHAEAMACYELAIKLNANDADSHCNLGAFYTKVFHPSFGFNI
jgi:tetratricopeptide (TPR) repeat protein